MPTRFHTQAEYYLLLAQVAYTPEDEALLLSMGCAWHRLGQELDLRDADNGTDKIERDQSPVRQKKALAGRHNRHTPRKPVSR